MTATSTGSATGAGMSIGLTRLIAALALGVFAWSLSAKAQQPTRVPSIGILSDEFGSLATSFKPFA
jgi:hypothetical protein